VLFNTIKLGVEAKSALIPDVLVLLADYDIYLNRALEVVAA
jgi:hypothetical protein